MFIMIMFLSLHSRSFVRRSTISMEMDFMRRLLAKRLFALYGTLMHSKFFYQQICL